MFKQRMTKAINAVVEHAEMRPEMRDELWRMCEMFNDPGAQRDYNMMETVERFQNGDSVASLAREAGVTRPTIYHWLDEMDVERNTWDVRSHERPRVVEYVKRHRHKMTVNAMAHHLLVSPTTIRAAKASLEKGD